MVKERRDTRILMQPKAELIQKYTSLDYWGTKTIDDYFKEWCRKFPHKLAVSDSRGEGFTYSELDSLSTKLAKAFVNAGVRKGDIVSVQLPNWAKTAAIFCALMRIGAVVNPVLLAFRHRELAHVLSLCESVAYVIPSEFRDFDYAAMAEALLSKTPSLRRVIVLGEQVPEGMVSFEEFLHSGEGVDELQLERNKPEANDIFAILLTSGTEAVSKGVVHTHNTFIYSERSRAEAHGISPDDTLLMASPVAHAFGILCLVLCLIHGGSVVLQERYTIDEFVRLIQERRCTWSAGATPFLHDLVNFADLNNYDRSSFRLFACGGAPIPRQLVREAIRLGIKVAAVYGSTESPPHTVTPVDAPIEKVFQTDGKPVPGTEVKVVDENHRPLPPGVEGEEASRGPGVALGYFKAPELTSKNWDEEGWYYSGDLCGMDADGYIRIVGRKKDMIIRGGENIAPKELEDLLLELPNIEEAAVVGMPDERLGERMCAYMVLKKDRESIDLNEVVSFLQSKGVAKYKWPERIIAIEELPKTPSGKVQKYLLREDVRKR